LSGILKKKPLELQGDKPKGKIAQGVRTMKQDDLPWVEWESWPEEWVGDLVTIDQLKDHIIVVEAFEERQSTKYEGSYVVAQVSIGEEKFVLRTGSKAVVGSTLHMAHLEKIPFRAIVEQRKGKWPGGYYCFSAPTPPEQEG